MNRIVAAFCGGALFGLGLVVSGMINPAKVLGFLDVTGHWDPSLALVMATAIPIAAAGYYASRFMRHPVFAARFNAPDAQGIDMRLFSGAVLFGAGWGLAGYCPGPAIATMALGGWKTLVFVAAMAGGIALFDVATLRRLRRPQFPPKPATPGL